MGTEPRAWQPLGGLSPPAQRLSSPVPSYWHDHQLHRRAPRGLFPGYVISLPVLRDAPVQPVYLGSHSRHKPPAPQQLRPRVITSFLGRGVGLSFCTMLSHSGTGIFPLIFIRRFYSLSCFVKCACF